MCVLFVKERSDTAYITLCFSTAALLLILHLGGPYFCIRSFKKMIGHAGSGVSPHAVRQSCKICALAN